MRDICIVNLHFEPNRTPCRDHEHDNAIIIENILDRALQARVEETCIM